MAFTDYLVSKFEEAEPLDPGSPGVSGSCSCFGRVACRSFLSSPPSFSGSCFQPLCLPSPRPGLRSGLALFGSGPRRAPLSFVFVLAALLAVCFAAWSPDAGVGVPFFVSEFKGHTLEDAAMSLWLLAARLIRMVTSWSPWLLAARLISQGSSRSLD